MGGEISEKRNCHEVTDWSLDEIVGKLEWKRYIENLDRLVKVLN